MPKRTPSAIGQRLQQLRERAGVPARELDRLADITEGHTSLIETGVVQRATADTIGKLAHTLGATTDWMINGLGAEPSEADLKAAVAKARKAYASANTSSKPAA